MSDLKTTPYRSPALLALARGKPCLLNAVEACLTSRDTSTTVAAHSNQSKHGKGMGRKADDAYSVWACVHCHTWLDQGKAPKAEKVRAFDAAHARQVEEWLKIAINRPIHWDDVKGYEAAINALEELLK
jgi:Asp-tRNA(Asn)/Glu-tRNA(Gln) amidotransferase A subunit family amidase